MNININKTEMCLRYAECADDNENYVYGPLTISQCPDYFTANGANASPVHKNQSFFPANSALRPLVTGAVRQINYMASSSPAFARRFEAARACAIKCNLNLLADAWCFSFPQSIPPATLMDVLKLTSIPKGMRWSLVEKYHRYRWNRWKIELLNQYMVEDEEQTAKEDGKAIKEEVFPPDSTTSQREDRFSICAVRAKICAIMVYITYLPRLLWLYLLLPFAMISSKISYYKQRDGLVEVDSVDFPDSDVDITKESNDIAISADIPKSIVADCPYDKDEREESKKDTVCTIDYERGSPVDYIFFCTQFLSEGNKLEDMIDSRVNVFRKCCIPYFVALLEICQNGSPDECDNLRNELRAWVKDYCHDRMNGFGDILKKDILETIEEQDLSDDEANTIKNHFLLVSGSKSFTILIALAKFDPWVALSLIADIVQTDIDAQGDFWMDKRYLEYGQNQRHPDPFATAVLAEHEVILQIWERVKEGQGEKHAAIRKALRGYMIYWKLKRMLQQYPYHVCNHRWMRRTHDTARRLLELGGTIAKQA